MWVKGMEIVIHDHTPSMRLKTGVISCPSNAYIVVPKLAYELMDNKSLADHSLSQFTIIIHLQVLLRIRMKVSKRSYDKSESQYLNYSNFWTNNNLNVE